MKIKSRFIYLTLVLGVILLFPIQNFAKDEWISVSSKNFFLLGNGSEKEIRQVATKLEQFRETFRRLFPRANFNAGIQTNVVVFKNSSSYKPFKPKRADGKADEWIAGYFQPGEDVNYITLSTEGEKEDTYGTIFHEYVHFMLNTHFGRSVVPPWFNEGLAEYYQTFQIKDDQKVSLGLLQNGHLQLLQQSQMIPLKTFFETDNYSLHQNGNHSRSIFYAQAWALIHYLTQANKGANVGNMSKFLTLVMNKTDPEKAFQETFQYDYATMEKALNDYVRQRKFMGTMVNFEKKLVFDTEMKSAPLSESEANAYLGDLLYHTHEFEDAEVYLQKSLALDPNSSMANISFGLVKMRQRKFDEAKKHLEKALAGDQKNHFAQYNYAYILSRESRDEFGYVASFPPDAARKMREALHKAITIKPDFTESYRLLAFINMVNNENLDESIGFLKKGLALQPGNQEYALLIAQIYLRQEKYSEAKEIAQKLAKTAAEPELRSNAQNVLNSINTYEESRAEMEKSRREMEAKGLRPPKLIRKETLSDEEVAKIEQESQINGINNMIERPKEDEEQIVGHLQKIECVKGTVIYTVKTENEVLTLTGKDFQSLEVIAMTEEAEELQIGCNADLQSILAVITYRKNQNDKLKSKGDLLAMVFVPEFFKRKTAEELAKAEEVYIVEERPRPAEDSEEIKAKMEEQRKEAMLNSLKAALRQPQAGEKREMGIVEKIECKNNLMIFYVKTETQTLRLGSASSKEIKMAAFTPEVEQMRIGCGVKLPPVSAVITYRLGIDLKGGSDGELIFLEFVPKSFRL